MEADFVRLATAMDRFAGFLREHGEARWAEWVSADAERVRAGDYYGVEHFLSAFGGMGSINDLVFPGAPPEERPRLWQQRDEVAERAYALAAEIRRSHEARKRPSSN